MRKILLVDDVQLLLEIQKRFLESSHVHILTANDGEEAFAIAQKERPDLIIMDKFMPNMDGLTCCRQLKGTPSLAHIPIIMSTNAATAADAEEYFRAGCVDVLSKPIESRLFLSAIKKHIPEIDRRSIRVPLELPTQLHLNGADYQVTTENLSLNGAFAVADLNLAVNDKVKLTFVLPEKDIPIEVKARVVWQRQGDSGTGFGAEFMEVTGQGISMLRVNELKTFVNSHPAARGLADRASR